jgi:ribA/ribD-fused uncharacterized protein
VIKIPYYESSHFVFSNFSPHSIEFDGILFPTAEHAFHAAKFDDPTIKSEIQHSRSPLEAYTLGKKYKDKRRGNWDDIKLDTLYQIMVEKVAQHTEVKDALLATGNEEIVEDNPNDDYWGNGADGKGQNQTGKILMRIREELKANSD